MVGTIVGCESTRPIKCSWKIECLVDLGRVGGRLGRPEVKLNMSRPDTGWSGP